MLSNQNTRDGVHRFRFSVYPGFFKVFVFCALLWVDASPKIIPSSLLHTPLLDVSLCVFNCSVRFQLKQPLMLSVHSLFILAIYLFHCRFLSLFIYYCSVAVVASLASNTSSARGSAQSAFRFLLLHHAGSPFPASALFR